MQKIQIKSRSFVKSTKIAIASLESFVKLHHDEPSKGPSGDQLLKYTISQTKDQDESKRIDAACDLCQM